MWGQFANNQVNLTEPVVSEHGYEKYETAAAPRKQFDFITILKLCQFSGARAWGMGVSSPLHHWGPLLAMGNRLARRRACQEPSVALR